MVTIPYPNCKKIESPTLSAVFLVIVDKKNAITPEKITGIKSINIFPMLRKI